MILDAFDIEVAAGDSFSFEGKRYGRCGHCEEPILPSQDLRMALPWKARKEVACHAPCAAKVKALSEAERQLAEIHGRYRQANS